MLKAIQKTKRGRLVQSPHRFSQYQETASNLQQFFDTRQQQVKKLRQQRKFQKTRKTQAVVAKKTKTKTKPKKSEMLKVEESDNEKEVTTAEFLQSLDDDPFDDIGEEHTVQNVTATQDKMARQTQNATLRIRALVSPVPFSQQSRSIHLQYLIKATKRSAAMSIWNFTGNLEPLVQNYPDLLALFYDRSLKISEQHEIRKYGKWIEHTQYSSTETLSDDFLMDLFIAIKRNESIQELNFGLQGVNYDYSFPSLPFSQWTLDIYLPLDPTEWCTSDNLHGCRLNILQKIVRECQFHSSFDQERFNNIGAMFIFDKTSCC